MSYSVRKTAVLTAGLVMAVFAGFHATAAEMPSVTDMQTDAFQGTGSGVASADIPDMSGNLFDEMPSGTDAASVEMPDISATADNVSIPDAGGVNSAQQDMPVTETKKNNSAPAGGTGTTTSAGSTQMNNPFSGLADSVVGNLSFDADGYLSQLMGDSYGGINSSLFNMEMPDVSFADLNSQFAQMKATMDLKTSSISMELPSLSLNATSASSAKEAFGQEYGGIANGTGGYSIPSGFDANAFLQQGFSAQADMKKAFEGSVSFNSVNSYVGGASDIVKEATGKLDSGSAFDKIGDLQTKINNNKSLVDNAVPNQELAGSDVNKWVNGKKNSLKRRNNSAYQTALDNYNSKKEAGTNFDTKEPTTEELQNDNPFLNMDDETRRLTDPMSIPGA